MKDRTLKNQKKHINKTLKQFRLAKTMIQLSITGTVSVITASLSFYFCPGFSSQIVDEADPAFTFVQTASHRKFQELEDFFKNRTRQNREHNQGQSFQRILPEYRGSRYIFCHLKDLSGDPLVKQKTWIWRQSRIRWQFLDAAILDTSMGPMYYYNQGDTRWSSYLYGGSDPMLQYGCGPTVAAMLISSFTNDGEAITPVTIADWSAANGYYAPQGGSYHSLDPFCPWGLWLPGGICNASFSPECSFPSFFRTYPGRPYG